MKFDIEEEHFTVFNLLILLLAWALVCIFIVTLFRPLLPTLIITLLAITTSVLMIASVIITIVATVRWIRHHNLGWWALIALIVLLVVAFSLEATVKSISIRQQMFEQQEAR